MSGVLLHRCLLVNWNCNVYWACRTYAVSSVSTANNNLFKFFVVEYFHNICFSFIGGLYGRIVGYMLVDWFGVHTDPESYWSWMDPGAFALVGAASFFAGVSRLTMSLTVIMVTFFYPLPFPPLSFFLLPSSTQ